MTDQLAPPSTVSNAFIATAHRIVWCSVASIDRRGRPRSRILHPYWEAGSVEVTGWVITRRTPLKVAHLAHSPYLTCTYWDPSHDVAIADCAAEWVDDRVTHEHVWALFRDAEPPLGYDFTQVFPDGPSSPEAALIRLIPWRLHITDVRVLNGEKPALTWQAAHRLPIAPLRSAAVARAATSCG